jgi:hypothetical protein
MLGEEALPNTFGKFVCNHETTWGALGDNQWVVEQCSLEQCARRQG